MYLSCRAKKSDGFDAVPSARKQSAGTNIAVLLKRVRLPYC